MGARNTCVVRVFVVRSETDYVEQILHTSLSNYRCSVSVGGGCSLHLTSRITNVQKKDVECF